MSARLQHMMLVTEQRLEAKRGAIYTVALVAALLIAFVGSHVIAGMYWYAEGVFAGRELEKNLPRKAAAVPIPKVDVFAGMDCIEASRKAYSQCRMERVKGKKT